MAASKDEITATFQTLRDEAQRLAGRLTELTQRATTYHHLYEDSGHNHVFPLIAAHGALWAKGYFHFGRRLGHVLSLQYGHRTVQQTKQLADLDAFADAFREINRLVCVDTYTNYHLVKRFGESADLNEFMSTDLLTALGRIHWARQRGHELHDEEKRSVFRAHFLHEQEHVVGPRVQEAVEALDWPLLQAIALRPWIRFAYFPKHRSFWFRDFTDREERIRRGLIAFDIAARVGWNTVEARLSDYHSLPASFFADSVQHFLGMKRQVLEVSG